MILIIGGMMLADNLSIIQCHILFDDDRGKSRLEHQKSWKGIPSFGKIFEDCDFFVNYKKIGFKSTGLTKFIFCL